MKVNKDKFPRIEITPEEGMCIQNIRTGEVHSGPTSIGKSLTEADFKDITKEEYMLIKLEQVEGVDSKNEDN